MDALKQLYNDCIKNCDLDTIYTEKLYGEVFSRASPTKNSEMQISVDSSAIRFDETTIHALLDAKLEGYLSNKAKSPSWIIEAKVIAVFTIDEKHLKSKDELDLFARKQGVLTLFPYLRSAVSNLSSDIGLGPITLPLIKFFPGMYSNSPSTK